MIRLESPVRGVSSGPEASALPKTSALIRSSASSRMVRKSPTASSLTAWAWAAAARNSRVKWRASCSRSR